MQGVALTAGAGVTALLGMAYGVHLARVLGPAAYAEVAALLSFVYVCAIVAAPLNATVTKFTVEYTERGAPGRVRWLVRLVLRRVAVWSVPALLAGAVALPMLARALHIRSPLPVLAAYAVIWLTIVVNVARGVLRGVHRFGQFTVNGVAEAACRLALGVILVHLAAGVTAGMMAYVLGLLAALAVSAVQLRAVWRGEPAVSGDIAPVFGFAAPMLLWACIWAAAQNVDMLLVQHLFAGEEAGGYGAASTLARSISVLFAPFNVLALPLLASLHERRGHTGRAFVRLCAGFLALAVPALVVFAIWPAPILTLLYGDAYRAAAPLLPLLGGAMALSCLAALAGQLFGAMSRFGFLWSYLAGLVVQVAGVLLWHPSPEAVARVVLGAHALTLLALLVQLVPAAWPRESAGDAGPAPQAV